MPQNSRERQRDAKIGEGLRKRDERALRALFDVCGPRVRAWLAREFGMTVADDALNRALDKAWAYASYDPSKGSLGGWFLRIASRCALDVLREANSGPTLVPPGYDPPNPPPPPPLTVRGRQVYRALHHAIGLLSAKQRTVIQADLAAGGPAPTSVLALRLNTTVQAVRALRCRAKAKLRGIMIEQGWFPPDKGDEADEE